MYLLQDDSALSGKMHDFIDAHNIRLSRNNIIIDCDVRAWRYKHILDLLPLIDIKSALITN